MTKISQRSSYVEFYAENVPENMAHTMHMDQLPVGTFHHCCPYLSTMLQSPPHDLQRSQFEQSKKTWRPSAAYPMKTCALSLRASTTTCSLRLTFSSRWSLLDRKACACRLPRINSKVRMINVDAGSDFLPFTHIIFLIL